MDEKCELLSNINFYIITLFDKNLIFYEREMVTQKITKTLRNFDNLENYYEKSKII